MCLVHILVSTMLCKRLLIHYGSKIADNVGHEIQYTSKHWRSDTRYSAALEMKSKTKT